MGVTNRLLTGMTLESISLGVKWEAANFYSSRPTGRAFQKNVVPFPSDSGNHQSTQNGGTVPYKAVLGVGFPLHRPYPYSFDR